MIQIESIMTDYETGKYSVHMLGDKYGMSDAWVYYKLKNAGCTFTKKRKKPFTDQERASRSKINKGKKLSPERIEAIRQCNSCNYNGLNGYGHTKKHNRGYILAYAPKHPNAHKDGYVMLHTVLIEQQIGRYLKADEVVHHINHKRTDNRLENLMLMTKHEHMSMHMRERHAKRRNDLSTKSF